MCSVDTFARLYLLHDPTSHARMLRPGARSKYHKVHHAPTPDDRAAHFTGDETLGHAPVCQFTTAPGTVMDAFRIFCLLEGMTAADALKHLSAQSQEVH